MLQHYSTSRTATESVMLKHNLRHEKEPVPAPCAASVNTPLLRERGAASTLKREGRNAIPIPIDRGHVA